MLLMSWSTVRRRFSKRLEAILPASRGHLEGLGRVWEAKMAPRCGLEGVLGSSWGRPGGVLRPSWASPGVSWGQCAQDGSQRPPGGGFEGFQRSLGGVCETSGMLRWLQDALSKSVSSAPEKSAYKSCLRLRLNHSETKCKTKYIDKIQDEIQ